LPSIGANLPYEIARRTYRWRHSTIALERRLELLKHELSSLPRPEVGIAVHELDPDLNKHLTPLRKGGRELGLADFDQDGGIASRFGRIAGIRTIDRAEFMPRSGCSVVLVDLDGRLGVRKEFGNSVGRFVIEIEALMGLERFDSPVPRIMNVDWHSHSITMTFIRGDAVRELLAAAGAKIRDRDEPNVAYTRSVDKQRIRDGRTYLPRVLSREQVRQIAEALASIHRAGFALEDVKFGNIIIEAESGAPFFIDLERALPLSSLPRRLADYLREVDLRKLREHFGHLLPLEYQFG
jgi:tRNA A-37 threonylcarbamoyl transferase component Bud32